MKLTAGFSLENAEGCLEAARYAYDHTCSMVSALAHGVVIEAGNARVMAFRGSASARDWLTDFEFGMRDVPMLGGGVHHGFADAIESIAPVVLERADWVKGPLFVAGHSLGGAMALLAAVVLERAGFPVAGVYTFGGPRVGNGGWARSYDGRLGERTFRVVNEEDIVPRVPGWPMGYRHVGVEVFLSSLGGMTVGPSLWRKCVSDLVGTYLDWRRGRIAQLADHEALAYASRLQELAVSQVPMGEIAEVGSEPPIEDSQIANSQ